MTVNEALKILNQEFPHRTIYVRGECCHQFYDVGRSEAERAYFEFSIFTENSNSQIIASGGNYRTLDLLLDAVRLKMRNLAASQDATVEVEPAKEAVTT